MTKVHWLIEVICRLKQDAKDQDEPQRVADLDRIMRVLRKEIQVNEKYSDTPSIKEMFSGEIFSN